MLLDPIEQNLILYVYQACLLCVVRVCVYVGLCMYVEVLCVYVGCTCKCRIVYSVSRKALIFLANYFPSVC